jgi:hypothetical protein
MEVASELRSTSRSKESTGSIRVSTPTFEIVQVSWLLKQTGHGTMMGYEGTTRHGIDPPNTTKRSDERCMHPRSLQLMQGIGKRSGIMHTNTESFGRIGLLNSALPWPYSCTSSDQLNDELSRGILMYEPAITPSVRSTAS